MKRMTIRLFLLFCVCLISPFYGDKWNEILIQSKNNRFIYSNFFLKSKNLRKLKYQIDFPLNEQNHTLLYYALYESQFQLAQLLIESGADLNAVYSHVVALCLERESKEDFRLLEFVKKQIQIALNQGDTKRENPWVKLLFERNFFYLKQIENKQYLIPKIIHQIWIGPNAIPDKVKWMMDSWQKVNPTWEYRLWTNHDLDNLDMLNKDAFESATNWGMKSDILRCEILNQFGGVYVDVDFECLKPLDDLHYLYDFYCGIIPEIDNSIVANGVIGSRPGHPIIRSCLENWRCISSFATNIPEEIMALTGPYFLTNQLVKYLLGAKREDRAVALPVNYFFPFPHPLKNNYWNKLWDRKEILKRYSHPETVAIHYWATTWIGG